MVSRVRAVARKQEGLHAALGLIETLSARVVSKFFTGALHEMAFPPREPADGPILAVIFFTRTLEKSMPRSLLRVFRASVLSAIAAAPLVATASLIGDSVGCTNLAQGAQAICSPASATVGAGVEFGILLGSDRLFNIDVGATSVTFTLVDTLPFAFSSDIFVLSDLDFAGAPAGITGLGIDLSSVGSISGLAAGDFSFTSDSLTVDFRGVSYGSNPSGSFTVDFMTDPGAVPEPISASLAGVALLALWGARRRNVAQAPAP